MNHTMVSVHSPCDLCLLCWDGAIKLCHIIVSFCSQRPTWAAVPRSRAHREARPSWRHRRGRVSRPWKGGARSRCWHQPEPNHWWVFLRLVLCHVTCVCFVGQGHKVMPWYQHTDIYKSLTFAIGRELYISVSQLCAIMLCPITEKPIYINVFEFCILQRIIYIGESATCHNVMSRHLHTNIYKCLLILQRIIYIAELATCHNVMSRLLHTDIYKCLWILQSIIYIGESATCHNVMYRHLHTNIYKCLLILQRIIYIGESATCHNVMSHHRHTDIYKCLWILQSIIYIGE